MPPIRVNPLPTDEYSKRVEHAHEIGLSGLTILTAEWAILQEPDVARYFSEKSTVTVTLGVDTPGTVELPMLEAISLESTMKNKRGFVFHTGGSVRGLDFVPKPSDTDFEYLAVGGYNEKNERHFLHEKQEPGSYHNCIQIWRADLQLESERSAIMLDMCILHDFGVVQDLKWCLFGGYRENDPISNECSVLGVLAAICGDGSIRIFVIPHPSSFRQRHQLDENQCLYLRSLKPRRVLSLPRTLFTCIAWNHETQLACGTSEGHVLVWDLQATFDPDVHHRPHIIFNQKVNTHTRTVCWHGKFDTRYILSGGDDGSVVITDVYDIAIPIRMTRIRDFIYAVAWPGQEDVLMYGDIDYTIRALSAADARELNVTLRYGVHNGVIWCIAASDHHLYIASTSSDGAVKIAENTTRHKRRQPRHQTVYELKLEANGSFRYMDGFPVQYATSEKDISLSLSLVNPLQSIHKAAWNPNLKAAGWLVTGGPAGLCRLEFIGCGPTLDNK